MGKRNEKGDGKEKGKGREERDIVPKLISKSRCLCLSRYDSLPAFDVLRISPDPISAEADCSAQAARAGSCDAYCRAQNTTV